MSDDAQAQMPSTSSSIKMDCSSSSRLPSLSQLYIHRTMTAAVAMPTVPTLSLLSMNPSPAVVQSAQHSAASRHGLINLTRLVHSLDKVREPNASWLQVQKTWEVRLGVRAKLTLDCAVRQSPPGRSAGWQRTVRRSFPKFA